MASKFRQYMDKKGKWFKRFIVLFSLYLFAFGIHLIMYQLLMRSLSNQYERDFTTPLRLQRAIVIGILMATPFIAAYAAYRDTRWFHLFLSLVLGVGFAIQILYHSRNHVEQERILHHLIKVDLIAKFEKLPAEDRKVIEEIQQKNSCCGVFDWADYHGQTFSPNKIIPSSCCGRYNETTEISAGNCELDELPQVPGCKSNFDEAFRQRFFNYNFYQAALIGLISFQLWMNVLSWVLVLYGGRKEPDEPEEPLPAFQEGILFIVEVPSASPHAPANE